MQHPNISKDILDYEYIETAIRAYQRQLTFDLAVKLGEGIGWTLDSDQGKGSHQCLKKDGQTVVLSHPHGDTYVLGTARRILKGIFQPLVDSGQLKTDHQDQFIQNIEEHLGKTLTWLEEKASVSLQSLQEDYQAIINSSVPNLDAAEQLVDELQKMLDQKQVIIDQKDQQLAQLARDVQQVETEQQAMEVGQELDLGEALPENVDLDRLMSDLVGDQSSGDLRDIQGGLSVDEEIARISELAGTEVFDRNQELEQQIQQLTLEIQQLQGERQDFQTQLDAAQNLVQTLQEQVQNLETTAIAHDELQSTHGELLEQVQRLQEQEAHRHNLEEQVSSLTLEQESLQEQLTSLEQTNQRLQEQLDQQPEVDRETGEPLVTQPSNLADIEEELRQVRQHLGETEAEKQHLQNTIQDLNQEIAQLQQQIELDSAPADDGSGEQGESEVLQETSAAVEPEIPGDNIALVEQVKYLNQQLAVSQAAVKPLQERIASLQSQLSESEDGDKGGDLVSPDLRQEQQLNRRLKRQARRQENTIWIATLVSALIVALPMSPQWLRPLVVLGIPVTGAIAKKRNKE